MKLNRVNSFESVYVTEVEHQPNDITTQESFAQYGSSNLGGYHFVTNKFCMY